MIAAVDIETHDPHLEDWGPGSIRKDGYIIGIGVYCPELGVDEFFTPQSKHLQEILANPEITKVFHNGVYNLDWIMNGPNHFELNGRIEDTMTRETLLDSYAFSYSLDACCARRGIEGKNKGETIDEYWKQVGGKSKAVEHLKDIPFGIVSKYCRQDCKATYELFMAQQPLLEKEDLLRANDIECRLYPLLMDMRKNGFRVDVKGIMNLGDQLHDEYDNGVAELERTYGFSKGSLSLNSANDLEKIWRKEKLPIEYTSTGKPSFAAAVLDDCQHPVAHKTKYLKGLVKTLSFLDGWMDLTYERHLYPSFFPAKRDDGGTVTGRWSSRNPNLQQVPAREDKHGKEIRSLFIPEEGCFLGAFDYKQIEYRVFTHFASGEGALEAQKQFNENPNTDYHQMTIDLMGWGDLGKEGRHLAKNLNFGSIYGLGPRSFATKFKQNLLHNHPERDPDNLFPVAQSLMNEYFRKVPFVKPTCNKIMHVGQTRGYVRTLSGRRQRMPLDNGAYKLINYLIQGSAADLLKKGIVDAWDKGVFRVLKLHAQIHDESVFSIPKTREGYEACKTLHECMVNAYQLKIPLGVDTEIGNDWGHCDMDTWEGFKEAWEEDKGCL